jgi:hypothetical protein
MRTVALLAVFALVAGIYCGGTATPKAEAPKTAAAQLPAEAYQPLDSAQIAQLVVAAPGVAEALKAANYSPMPTEGEAIESFLPKMVDGMKPIAGVEDALKKVNVTWDAFRATFLKVTAASAAIGVDATASMAAEMAKDTSAGAKKAMKDFESLKATLASVPAANKDIVKKFEKDLSQLPLFGGR